MSNDEHKGMAVDAIAAGSDLVQLMREAGTTEFRLAAGTGHLDARLVPHPIPKGDEWDVGLINRFEAMVRARLGSGVRIVLMPDGCDCSTPDVSVRGSTLAAGLLSLSHPMEGG